ncbi:MAG: hypothetical protein OEM24_12260 [Paracoccaceae bacterium]|nr:hypothetical protein [Paracoccaceae bacterium]
MADPLRTRAGLLLYRHLPEEYRYRDNPAGNEPGDLEAFLHGFGHVLDLIRATLRQAHADAFAEPDETGAASQTWILPYLASLLGARLVAPDLDGTGTIRRAELNRTVAWSKGKGTLGVADDVADVLADAETVVVEGWRRVAICPRLSLPPYALPHPRRRGGGAGGPFPPGTPDIRKPSRAVRAADENDPLQSFQLGDGALRRTWYWRVLFSQGAPCQPGSYADRSVTTPDLRSRAGLGRLGPAPRRVTVHVQPNDGFFPAGLFPAAAPADLLETALAGHDPATGLVPVIGPEELLLHLPSGTEIVNGRLLLSGDLTLPGGVTAELADVSLLGTITIEAGAELRARRLAARKVSLPQGEEVPALDAKDCLFEELSGPSGFARLEYVTVLGLVRLARLWASDCLFAGEVEDATCLDKASCVRFSRLPAEVRADCVWVKAASNTQAPPRFVTRPFAQGAACAIRAAGYGEPGAGVLDLGCPPAIAAGAEDGTEMGAFHHRGLMARLAAMQRKLTDQLPLGQRLDPIHDPMLAIAPPALVAP